MRERENPAEQLRYRPAPGKSDKTKAAHHHYCPVAPRPRFPVCRAFSRRTCGALPCRMGKSKPRMWRKYPNFVLHTPYIITFPTLHMSLGVRCCLRGWTPQPERGVQVGTARVGMWLEISLDSWTPQNSMTQSGPGAVQATKYLCLDGFCFVCRMLRHETPAPGPSCCSLFDSFYDRHWSGGTRRPTFQFQRLHLRVRCARSYRRNTIRTTTCIS
jgi:hypothetical protein